MRLGPGSAPRWRRKAEAEAAHPDFPSLDVAALTIEEYEAAVVALLRDAGIEIPPLTLAWRDLRVSVPVAPSSSKETVVSGITAAVAGIRNGFANITHPHPPAEPAHVLDGVSGVLGPGSTCLVLGPSGAGSSLLLKRLARRDIGKGVEEEGDVFYNGRENLEFNPKHVINFVGQDDLHTPELTVRETLSFAGECRIPEWFPYADVMRRNNVVIISRALGIAGTLDTIVELGAARMQRRRAQTRHLRRDDHGHRERLSVVRQLVQGP